MDDWVPLPGWVCLRWEVEEQRLGDRYLKNGKHLVTDSQEPPVP